MRHLVVVLLAATVLAGCLGSQAPGGSDPENAPPTGSGPGGEPGAAGTSDPTQGHVHDLWDGQTERTLVDRSIPVRALQAGAEQATSPETILRGCGAYDALLPSPTCLGYAEFRPEAAEGERNVVPPGTATIRATVSWSAETVTGVELRFEPAFDPGWRTLGVAGASGETMVLDVSERMPTRESFPLSWTDDGHAQASRWEFALAAYAGDGFAAVAEGEVDVTIEVERADGPLPLEPRHPDWYGDTSTYRLGSATRNVTESWEQVQVWWMNEWSYFVHLAPDNPVPPGTREVVFEVSLSDNSPVPETPATAKEVDLFYATDGGYASNFGDGPTADKTRDGDTWTFRIPVEPSATDSIYTCGPRDSLWDFAVWVHPPTVQEPVFDTRHPTAMHFDGRIRIDGVATETTGETIDDLAPADVATPDRCGEVVADA